MESWGIGVDPPQRRPPSRGIVKVDIEEGEKREIVGVASLGKSLVAGTVTVGPPRHAGRNKGGVKDGRPSPENR